MKVVGAILLVLLIVAFGLALVFLEIAFVGWIAMLIAQAFGHSWSFWPQAFLVGLGVCVVIDLLGAAVKNK